MPPCSHLQQGQRFSTKRQSSTAKAAPKAALLPFFTVQQDGILRSMRDLISRPFFRSVAILLLFYSSVSETAESIRYGPTPRDVVETRLADTPATTNSVRRL
jgi:hypothetical protein